MTSSSLSMISCGSSVISYGVLITISFKPFLGDLVRQPDSRCIDGAVQITGNAPTPHAAPGQLRRVSIVHSAAGVAMQLGREAEHLLRAAEGLTRAAAAVLASTTSAFPKNTSAARGKEPVGPTPGQKDAEKQTGATGR